MSRLILKGDTVSNFGKHLPTPYIERIEIHPVSLEEASEWFEGELREHNDTATAVSEWKKYFHSETGIYTLAETQFIRIHINLSLLFNTSSEFLSQEFIQNMRDNLYINFMLLRNEQQIKNLKNSKKGLLGVFNVSLFDSNFLETFRTYPLSDYVIPVDWSVERDENYNQILKIPNLTAEFIMTSDMFDAEHITVFAASSIADPMSGILLQNAAVLYALNFSDVAYEDLVLDGKVAYRTGEGYYAEDGSFYTGAPIMGLNNRYHKTDNFGSQDIIDGIRSITSEYKKYQTRNKKINSALENIEYIIARFGETPELIKQLNKLSRVFPGANTSTPIGRLYTRFARAVVNANSSLIEQPEVKKRLIRNVKIQDYRPFEFVSDYGGSYNADLEPEDLLYPLYLQTNLAKYIEKPEGSTDAEAPYTPETAGEMIKEAIQTIMQRLTDWSPRSNDIYIPLRRRFASMLGEVNGEIYGQVQDFDNWINRDIKIKAAADSSQRFAVWDHARGEWQFAADGYTTWYDVFGIAIGPDAGASEEFNPTLAFAEWFGYNASRDRPTTMGGCTFEYGLRLNNCTGDENFAGDEVEDPYKCFQRLARYGYLARTRNQDQQKGPHYEYSTAEGRRGLRIYTKNSHRNAFYEWSDGTEAIAPLKDLGFQSDLMDAQSVQNHLDGIFGLEELSVLEEPEMADEFDRLVDFSTDNTLNYGEGGLDRSIEQVRNQFEMNLDSDAYVGSYLQAMCKVIQKAIKGMFGLKGSLGRVNGGTFLEAANNEESWAELAAQISSYVTPGQQLYDATGNVNTDVIEEYAEVLVAQLKLNMINELRSWFDGEWGDGMTDGSTRHGYLSWRWCPSEVEKWSSWSTLAGHPKLQAKPENTKPRIFNVLYSPGGDWPFSSDEGFAPTSLVWDGGNAGILFDYLAEHGSTTYAGGMSMSRSEGAKLGDYELNVYSRIKTIMSEFWDDHWEFRLKGAVRDIVTLLATYRGISYNNGEWRKLANVNIVVQKNGWFFFDMQKYMQEQSEISQYLDPARIEATLPYGRDLLNYYIRLHSTELETNAIIAGAGMDGLEPAPMPGPVEHDKISTIELEAEYSIGDHISSTTLPPFVSENRFKATNSQGGTMVPKAKIKAIDAAGWEDFRATKSGDIKIDGKNAEKININAYLMLRNYDFPFEDISNDYRLMAFNYNYFVDDDEAAPNHSESDTKYVLDGYFAKVNVGDSSLRILIGFNDHLKTVLREVESYLEEAQENCAFNEFNSEFNTFFKEQMAVRYEDNPQSAPWIRGPMTYALFRDLFENVYGGDYYSTMEAARQFMDAINPETGWLSALQEFVELLRELTESFETHIAPVLELPSTFIHSYREYDVKLPHREIDVIDYTNDTTGDFPELEGE